LKIKSVYVVFFYVIQTSCYPVKLDLIKGKDLDTEALIISERNNRVNTEDGILELNMVYNRNNKNFTFDFIYIGQDWIYLDSTKILMFLFNDSNYYVLKNVNKTLYSTDNPNNLFKATGKIPLPNGFLRKIIDQKIYGIRLNGKYKFKEYKNGIAKMESRWEKTIYEVKKNETGL